MEDVLDLYAEAAAAPDAARRERPLVCFDEQPLVLRADAHPGQPCTPGEHGHPTRVDYEYVRQGTACCLLAFAPFDGWRHVTVAEHRANADFAHAMRRLVDVDFPDAVVIRIVLDNLSTHSAAALYQTFPPAEARRIAAKLEFHYTPLHASWLNIAELELAVLTRQCLDRRLPTRDAVAHEVAAWERERNWDAAGVTWRFTIAAARLKLARLYPEIA
jgi:hypothetical protein